MKIALGTGVAVAIAVGIIFLLIQLNIIYPLKSYRINDLIVTSPGGRSSDWSMVKANENVLVFKIMTLEPVVRRYEFITHELITVSYHVGGVIPSYENAYQYFSLEKIQLVNILGLMLQDFLQGGFEIGGNSSFIKIAGADAYRFELVRHEIPVEQWIRGEHAKYTTRIVVWRGDWYSITYSNFDNAVSGPHFSDFEIFLEELEFV